MNLNVIRVHTDKDGRLLHIETSNRNVLIFEKREGDGDRHRFPKMFTGEDMVDFRAGLERSYMEPTLRKDA